MVSVLSLHLRSTPETESELHVESQVQVVKVLPNFRTITKWNYNLILQNKVKVIKLPWGPISSTNS